MPVLNCAQKLSTEATQWIRNSQAPLAAVTMVMIFALTSPLAGSAWGAVALWGEQAPDTGGEDFSNNANQDVVPSLNELGEVAFQAQFGLGGDGIFALCDGALEAVVLDGDLATGAGPSERSILQSRLTTRAISPPSAAWAPPG